MKIFVSAGHGGSDPGAVGNGLLEKDCNLSIALAFGKVLESAGVEVVYSRTKDENDPVTQEVLEANWCQANYAISFHNNASGGIGSESYYYPGDDKGRKIAELFEACTVAAGAKSRGAKTTTNLYFIRNTRMTAVLNESAFIDSSDYKRIDSPEKCEKIGQEYAKAFLEFLGLKSDNGVPRETFKSFQIKSAKKKLYVYKDTNRDSEVTHIIEDKRRYTVVECVENEYLEVWGKLKSGIGWIHLDDCTIIGE